MTQVFWEQFILDMLSVDLKKFYWNVKFTCFQIREVYQEAVWEWRNNYYITNKDRILVLEIVKTIPVDMWILNTTTMNRYLLFNIVAELKWFIPENTIKELEQTLALNLTQYIIPIISSIVDIQNRFTFKDASFTDVAEQIERKIYNKENYEREQEELSNF